MNFAWKNLVVRDFAETANVADAEGSNWQVTYNRLWVDEFKNREILQNANAKQNELKDKFMKLTVENKSTQLELVRLRGLTFPKAKSA